MLASIVVPAYNEEKYIRHCLRSLMSQDHPGFEYEVIVVDDGSTDRTAAIARQHGARVISQPRRGVSGARQAGFEAARGEIIASMDADTIPPRDWLYRLVTELAKGPDIIGVYGPVRLSDGPWYADWAYHHVSGVYFWLSSCIRKPNFSGQNFAVRREAWARVGGFDPGWASAEDLQLSLKLAHIGRVKFCWDIVVPTSGRRIQEGYGTIVKHSISNYLRVMWLHAPPLPVRDFR